MSGWTASQLGKDPATVGKWCTNSAQPALETMMQIALPEIPTIEDIEEKIQ